MTTLWNAIYTQCCSDDDWFIPKKCHEWANRDSMPLGIDFFCCIAKVNSTPTPNHGYLTWLSAWYSEITVTVNTYTYKGVEFVMVIVNIIYTLFLFYPVRQRLRRPPANLQPPPCGTERSDLNLFLICAIFKSSVRIGQGHMWSDRWYDASSRMIEKWNHYFFTFVLGTIIVAYVDASLCCCDRFGKNNVEMSFERWRFFYKFPDVVMLAGTLYFFTFFFFDPRSTLDPPGRCRAAHWIKSLFSFFIYFLRRDWLGWWLRLLQSVFDDDWHTSRVLSASNWKPEVS